MKASLDNLQEVVVTANRDAALRTQAPIAINRISPQTLDETKATSVYEVINKEGAVHAPVFTVQVTVGTYQQIATGKSIKEAEKDAARKLLNRLKK